MKSWVSSRLRKRRATSQAPEVEPFTSAVIAPHAPYGTAQLTEHAARLARQQKLLPAVDSDGLLQRLARQEADLDAAFRSARSLLGDNHTLEPAAEWLVDNFYLIKEQIKEIRAGLPRSYRRKLPTVATAGERIPRSLALMRELVQHTDSSIRLSDVRNFIDSYQDESNLTLGELWSIPLMLRFALVEQLQPLGVAIVTRMTDAAMALRWSVRLHEVARKRPSDLVMSVADMARSEVNLTPAFVTEFQRLMQDGNPALNLATLWLDQQLNAHRLSIADALEQQGRVQAASQVSISNCVASIRVIRRSDWSGLIESLSSVEVLLRQDPAGVYAHMDFTTRDHYRHVLEALAEHCDSPEWDVARRVLERAATSSAADADGRKRHVGYWLVGGGNTAFMRELGVHQPFHERLSGWLKKHPSLPYVAAIAALTCALAAGAIPGMKSLGAWHTAMISVVVLLAMSHASVAIVNWVVTLWVAPRMLPRMAFKHGIPDSARTLVAVPCMLGSKSEIAELVSALEIRNLVNRDKNLYFALLADFTDAPQQHMAADKDLLAASRAAVEALNQTHESNGSKRFCLFIRDREWNEHEGVWMGKERKRGKLSDLNGFLRDDPCGSLRLLVGEAHPLRAAKYVITLDADTELPPQSAMSLIATMAHPLNHPLIDPVKHRVVAGYGILQPRVSVEAGRDVASRFAQLHSDDVGLDPYTRVVSDVYQDLFDEASYIGKGIYDIDAFAATTGKRFPENLILSHDLLEGSYARAGLVSDVELFEHHPDRYGADLRRRHRWIRGDWQILPWLLPWVPGPRGRWVRNGLSGHQRTKIFDNLRRSLVPAALLVMLLNGWLLSTRPVFWTLISLGVLFAPPLLISIRHFLSRHPRMSWGVHFRLNREGLLRRLEQTALFLVMLPSETKVYLDAIGRSLWRLFISGRHRLQWTPASELARTSPRGLSGYFGSLWAGPAIAVFVVVVLCALHKSGLAQLVAAPILLAWFLSPWIAWSISQARKSDVDEPLDTSQKEFLGVVARRTWAFFEHTVSAESHHLPPDNYQCYPSNQIAHRTSPTNIGMYLVSALSAYDFGYITASQLLERIEACVDTLEDLPRHRGHFLNWYDTQTLAPLKPRYVSSVDSGNLLGCLLVLARGLEMLEDQSILPVQTWCGLRHEWDLFVRDAGDALPAYSASANDVTRIGTILAHPPDTLSALVLQLETLSELAECLEAVQHSFAPSGDAAQWLGALSQHVQSVIGVAAGCATWLDKLPQAANEQPTVATQALTRNPSWRDIGILARRLIESESECRSNLLASVRDTLKAGTAQRRRATDLAARCRALCDVEYDFLCLPHQPLLSIGFNIDQNTLDEASYDLLASEARLASFVGIAQGRLSRRNWFALGRLLTLAAGRPALVSWSGSMFEYLMPLLLMPSFENTLLTRTCRTVIDRQIGYGREHGVPWGVSESAYNTRDADLVYQYRAFGVPGLGLKRGLADDLVVAPYASAMAVLLKPASACSNLQRLAGLGAAGTLGFFDAVDYTPSRVPADADFAVVRTYMAHHQGMILTALSGVLNGRPLQHRFLQEPMFRANRLLLQEKVPAALLVDSDTLSADEVPELKRSPTISASVITRMDTSVPQLQLLSNGRYHVVISQTGGGFSQWGDLAVNHWREDPVCDGAGIFCYVQDLDRGELWSNSMQPTGASRRNYEAIYSQASAEYQRSDYGIETHTRIAVSAEDDIELRRITLTNRSGKRRRLALTSYLEWVLTRRSDELAHPVFNKMFVETAQLAHCQAITARRRPRSPDENSPSFFHMMVVANPDTSGFSFETRRDVFLGRDGSLASPSALLDGAELGNGIGAVLDPIAAIRRQFVLDPGQSVSVDMITGAAPDQDHARVLAERYAEGRFDNRVFDVAWTREQVIGHQLGLGLGDRKRYARMASSVIYCDPAIRRRSMHAKPTNGQSGLWKYGISGDLPIVLLRVSGVAEMSLVRQMLVAHSYWRLHGIDVDLVIWNEDSSGYRQELQDRIMGLIGSSVEAPALDRPGGVFVRRGELLAPDDRSLLTATARIVIDGRHGSLEEQLPSQSTRKALPKPLKAQALGHATQDAQLEPPETPETPETLLLFNGTGGYSSDGREYVICLPPGKDTPRPWVNVLANEHFGSVISERGSAYTFAENAHEFRLTPWHNDPVLDSGGEAFYVRDDDELVYWSPTPWPVRGEGAHVIRHGFGYSQFRTEQRAIQSELTVFVAVDAPVKYSVLKLRNASKHSRKLSVFGYVEWVLGDHREQSAPHVRSTIEPHGRAVFASNSFNEEFPDKQGVFAMSDAGSASADRKEFIGRNRTLGHPAAMRRGELQGHFGAGLDPCGALQSKVVLEPGEEYELVFVLGVADDETQARALYSNHASLPWATHALAAVKTHWHQLLGTVEVDTPDATINVLLNGWLTYQVIASRLWARSGFYQSGGAFGFRDQLQDSVSLLDVDPRFAREQIVRAAGHQFNAGDVQHWWHPPRDRGVRTRISDDYLWLPWAVAQYVNASGDLAILDVTAPYLGGRKLGPDEESRYDVAEKVGEGSLYDHCRRAILHGLRFGEHGLPLIGGGDWNDGMNLLGIRGRGESVWLAFFLIEVLHKFAPLAAAHADPAFERRCIEEAVALAQRIEESAWDGAWYRRAWSDDGQVVGSRDSDECRIDSLPQSWAALTATGSLERREQALKSAIDKLLRPEEQLLQLFDPPFDDGPIEPGYIKGYIPGIRENGGQYTHAAVWLGMACAALGRCDSAWEIMDAINPVKHARNETEVSRYQVEPYVLAADVYWAKAHRGRGGWSWYTGSAGWLRRFMLESLLGLTVRNGELSLRPCPHPQWDSYRLQYPFGKSMYQILVSCRTKTNSVPGLFLDGAAVSGDTISLVDDAAIHQLTLILDGS